MLNLILSSDLNNNIGIFNNLDNHQLCYNFKSDIINFKNLTSSVNIHPNIL